MDLVEFSTRAEQSLDALTAGLVMLARQRGIPWKVLAAVFSAAARSSTSRVRSARSFHVSGESAGRTYHEHHVRVRRQELAGSSEMPGSGPPHRSPVRRESTRQKHRRPLSLCVHRVVPPANWPLFCPT
ncbi:hypothetical protein [Streptomyces flavidovirens]|uniref:hypothetical protein n=1 Tax=Streptomyces flavidovirens TaxID=67298 RepID=UPI003689EF59